MPSGIGQFSAIQALAPTLGVEINPIGTRDTGELERAVAAFASSPNGGLVVTGSAWAVVHRDLIIGLAARHKLPAVFFQRLFVAGGGLIAYGADFAEQYRQAAGYVDRILRGEKPADLPVQATTKFELALNLQTAKALGLEVPPTLLSVADEVIADPTTRVHHAPRRRGGVAARGRRAAALRLAPAYRLSRIRCRRRPARAGPPRCLSRRTWKLGWADGRTIRIDYRWGVTGQERARAVGAELVGLSPKVILSEGTSFTQALMRETRTVPIVFVSASDPLRALRTITESHFVVMRRSDSGVGDSGALRMGVGRSHDRRGGHLATMGSGRLEAR